MNNDIKTQDENTSNHIEKELKQFFMNIYDVSGLDKRKLHHQDHQKILINNNPDDATDHME